MVPEWVYPLNSEIEKAFDDSECIVVEADLQNADSMKLQLLIIKKGMYPEGETLKENIPENLYDRLEEEFKKLGLPLESMNRMRPWFVALTLTALRMKQLGFDESLGIDMYFLKKAKDKKEIFELESADFQVNLLSGFSKELQALFLQEALEDQSTLKEEMEKMISYWKTGNVEKMTSFLSRTRRKHPELEPVFVKLIDERNVGMTGKIEGYLKKTKTYFVIVGAGHLVGERGIVSLLKAKGFAPQKQ